ncbi:hypothetical protein J6590_094772 [Homalodisca vitripennis]|nr:hypothetical protein J6590_094772 [Homalodisca vitripennis]
MYIASSCGTSRLVCRLLLVVTRMASAISRQANFGFANDEQDETAEHLLFDCPEVAREQFAGRASWCASGVCKRLLRLKCLAIGRPIEEEEE